MARSPGSTLRFALALLPLAAACSAPEAPRAPVAPAATNHAVSPPAEVAPAAKPAPPAPAAFVPAAAAGDEPLGAAVDESDRPPPKAPGEGIASEGAAWGDAIGESFGAGGLGLSGIGEGGGGRSEGIGLGSIGTLGHGAGTSGSHSAAPGQALPGGVRAGEWDDNANFREFARWLGKTDAPGATQLDLSVRRFVVVRDADGKPVPSCLVDVADAAGGSPALTLTTTSNGRALLFPRAEGLRAATLVATARCQGVVALKQVKVGVGDGVVDLQLPVSRVLPEAPSIDVAFVVDTTGSMAEEIDALRGALAKVSGALAEVGVRPRVGLVEYKDKGDEYITRLHPMTTDLPALSARIDGIRAAGGGDGPEHVNQALRTAIRGLKFRPESVARLVFVVGDAPPHLDYEGDEGYFPAVREASRAGIQIHTIAASGMDHLGQVVFRQVAQYTGASNLFVLRGGAGPQSVGGGDPETSCGGSRSDYQSGNLDALILRKIRAAIGALGRDPLRIAGLHRDEQELPCDQRVSSQ